MKNTYIQIRHYKKKTITRRCSLGKVDKASPYPVLHNRTTDGMQNTYTTMYIYTNTYRTITRRCSLGKVDKAPTQSFIIVQRSACRLYLHRPVSKKKYIYHLEMFFVYGGQSPYPVIHAPVPPNPTQAIPFFQDIF